MAIFTGRTERAIAVAIEAHGDQTRKTDGTTPCIVHPVTVALILSRYTDDEDTIIAGLLIGIIEAFTVQYLGSGLIDLVVFAMLLAMLVVRPTGLIAERKEENV